MRFLVQALALFALLWIDITEPFSLKITKITRLGQTTTTTTTALQSFAVSASSLEEGLSREEQAVVRTVREAGPSVAFITSVLTAANVTTTDNTLPPGNSLGSGSAFVVDASGYLCTNYHVIEYAYQVQQTQALREQMLQELQGNISSLTGIDLKTLQEQQQHHPGWLGFPLRRRREPVSAQVYVRINSLTKYQRCRIVDVSPSLEVAVLKIEDDSSSSSGGSNSPSDTTDNKPLSFGSSSKLLVGQQLIAIGNPFGLDNSVTTGVVSALNREIRVGRNRMSLEVIRNCIQTDCAINPGNSGGPLLNRKGEVVGVNTAIVTTSGSSAGIGFAVPSDLVQPVVQGIIRNDKKRLRPMAFLGVQIVRFHGTAADSKSKSSSSLLGRKNWITAVQPGSPAANAGMRSLRVTEDGKIEYGDAIVAIGGNAVNTFSELQREMDRRIAGEQLQVTLEDELGNRRVVYVTAISN